MRWFEPVARFIGISNGYSNWPGDKGATTSTPTPQAPPYTGPSTIVQKAAATDDRTNLLASTLGSNTTARKNLLGVQG